MKEQIYMHKVIHRHNNYCILWNSTHNITTKYMYMMTLYHNIANGTNTCKSVVFHPQQYYQLSSSKDKKKIPSRLGLCYSNAAPALNSSLHLATQECTIELCLHMHHPQPHPQTCMQSTSELIFSLKFTKFKPPMKASVLVHSWLS